MGSYRSLFGRRNVWDIYTYIGVGGQRIAINSSTLDVKTPLSLGRYSGNLEAGCDRLARAILGRFGVRLHIYKLEGVDPRAGGAQKPEVRR